MEAGELDVKTHAGDFFDFMARGPQADRMGKN